MSGCGQSSECPRCGQQLTTTGSHRYSPSLPRVRTSSARNTSTISLTSACGASIATAYHPGCRPVEQADQSAEHRLDVRIDEQPGALAELRSTLRGGLGGFQVRERTVLVAVPVAELGGTLDKRRPAAGDAQQLRALVPRS